MEDELFLLDFNIEDIYLLYHSVNETIRIWPGSPARPAEEQEHLWYLRDSLYRCILDYKFKYME
jgi:hypothetical protein